MAYLLDSNVFIEAKRLHYGFDFCPAFWDWLDVKCSEGSVFSIARVATELFEGGDDLADWAKEREGTLFLEADTAVLQALAKVSAWATNGRYEPSAVNLFLDIADSYLVASGLAGSHTVVTRERADDAKKRIKIPNACAALGVKCITPFEMLRRERARFVLGAAE